MKPASKPAKKPYILTFAYDVPYYIDFLVHGTSEAEALAEAETALNNGAFDNVAAAPDDSMHYHRVFCLRECTEDDAFDLDEMKDLEGFDATATAARNGIVLQPAPTPTAPSREELLDACRISADLISKAAEILEAAYTPAKPKISAAKTNAKLKFFTDLNDVATYMAEELAATLEDDANNDPGEAKQLRQKIHDINLAAPIIQQALAAA